MQGTHEARAKLTRSTHMTWEAHTQDTWGTRVQHANTVYLAAGQYCIAQALLLCASCLANGTVCIEVIIILNEVKLLVMCTSACKHQWCETSWKSVFHAHILCHRVKSILGSCVSVVSGPAEVFSKCLVLYSLTTSPSYSWREEKSYSDIMWGLCRQLQTEDIVRTVCCPSYIQLVHV